MTDNERLADLLFGSDILTPEEMLAEHLRSREMRLS